MGATVTFVCTVADDGTPLAEDDPAGRVDVPRQFARECTTQTDLMGMAGESLFIIPDRAVTPARLRTLLGFVEWRAAHDLAVPTSFDAAKATADMDALSTWFATYTAEEAVGVYLAADYLAHAEATYAAMLGVARIGRAVSPDVFAALLGMKLPRPPAKRARTNL